MKYWYNPTLDAYCTAPTKPAPWIRLSGEVCEWQETDKATLDNAYKAWTLGERVL